VPQDLSGATVVHGRRPHGEDDVVGRKGGVIDESLVLLHTGVKRNIVVLAPATERVQKKDGVLVAELEELLTGILKKEDVTVVERVSNLEGVDGVGFLGLDLGVDLSGGHSVGVNTIVELNVLNEVHGLTRDEPVTLLHNSVDLRVLDGAGTEGSSGDLFLSVGEEDGVVDDGEDIVGELGALDGNSLLVGELFLLLVGNILGDGNRHEVSLTGVVGDGVHVHGLEELKLVHESLEGEGPTLTDGLDVFGLLLVNVDELEAINFLLLILGEVLDEGLNDSGGRVGGEDTLGVHLVEDLSAGLVEGLLTSVDVHLWVLGGFIGIGDTSEVGNDTGSSLLVESLNISAFANLEGGADVAFVESETSVGVDLSGEVSASGACSL